MIRLHVLNDTIMQKIPKRQQQIIEMLRESSLLQSSDIHAALMKKGDNASLVTIKRELSDMVETGLVVSEGLGRAVSYAVSTKGRVFAAVDAKAYCAVEPDMRHGSDTYNFDLFSHFPEELFSEQEMQRLNDATRRYQKNIQDTSPTAEKKELERLVVELSWKSSRIEGNTYTLLDTEKLIRDNIEAPGHAKEEAQMILNHKDAFRYVHEQRILFEVLTRKSIEEVHALVVKDMGISSGVRKSLVGILGSRYRPLDNAHQIIEAVDALCGAIARVSSSYTRALLALAGIAYIQPFEDGNKRTSRLVCNAVLLAHGCSPLSYRSVHEEEYREAMLALYELNTLMPLKKIFIEQYEFAVENYAVG